MDSQIVSKTWSQFENGKQSFRRAISPLKSAVTIIIGKVMDEI